MITCIIWSVLVFLHVKHLDIYFFCSHCVLFFLIVFADAKQKIEDPIGSYFTESNIFKIWSLMALPITLPIDLTYTAAKRYETFINNKFKSIVIDY